MVTVNMALAIAAIVQQQVDKNNTTFIGTRKTSPVINLNDVLLYKNQLTPIFGYDIKNGFSTDDLFRFAEKHPLFETQYRAEKINGTPKYQFNARVRTEMLVGSNNQQIIMSLISAIDPQADFPTPLNNIDDLIEAIRQSA